MSAIRRRVLADADGELRLRGLPIKKGEHAERQFFREAHCGQTTAAA